MFVALPCGDSDATALKSEPGEVQSAIAACISMVVSKSDTRYETTWTSSNTITLGLHTTTELKPLNTEGKAEQNSAEALHAQFSQFDNLRRSESTFGSFRVSVFKFFSFRSKKRNI